MQIKELKNKFLAQYTMASEFTKEKYKNDIELFLDVCNITSIERLNNLTEKEITRFYDYAREKHWAPSTINQRLAIAKLFTEWAFKKHYIDNDFLCDIKKIRTINNVRYTPTENECDTLITYIKEHTNKKRLYLMASLLFSCGLRRSEVCSLKVEDIDKINSSIRVMGKGKKIVEQPVPPLLMIQLVEYINTERKDTIDKYTRLGGKDLGFLFLSGIGEKCDSNKKDLLNGNQVNSNAFYQQIKRYSKLAGITNARKISPHGLRRSAGTRIYNSTGDIKTAKEFLRHSNISTTEACYIDYNKERVREAVNSVGQQSIEQLQIEMQPANKLSQDEEYQLFLLLKKKFGE